MNLGNNKSIQNKSAKMDAELLKIIKQHAQISLPDLSRITGRSVTSCDNALKRMQDRHEIHMVKKGNRNIWCYGTRQQAEQKERYTPTGYYTGDKFNPANNRPGCLDFLGALSLMGGKRVPYKTPMHGCVSTASHAKTK